MWEPGAGSAPTPSTSPPTVDRNPVQHVAKWRLPEKPEERGDEFEEFEEVEGSKGFKEFEFLEPVMHFGSPG